MATVDTGVRFNKFNSLKLEINETSWSQKFEVEFYSTITVQAQVLCVTGSASGQFILRWLDEDGKKIIDSTDGFSIENRWKRKTATFEVPEGAIECMFALKNADNTEQINVACAMAEAGEIASAFDPSLATQVSLLDAHGLYTGTVTAWQVIAGILQSLDGKAYFDLEKPEIVMQGKDATWKASPENPLRLEDEEGDFIGGLVRLPDGRMAVISSATGSAEDLRGGYLEVGRRVDPDTGKIQSSGVFFTGNQGGFNINETYGSEGFAGYHIRFKGESAGRIGFWWDGGTVIRDINGQNRLDIYANGSTYIRDENGKSRLLVYSDGATEIRDHNNVLRVHVAASGGYFLKDQNGTYRYWQDDLQTYLQSANGKYGFGVDDGGIFYIKNGVKTYL